MSLISGYLNVEFGVSLQPLEIVCSMIACYTTARMSVEKFLLFQQWDLDFVIKYPELISPIFSYILPRSRSVFVMRQSEKFHSKNKVIRRELRTIRSVRGQNEHLNCLFFNFLELVNGMYAVSKTNSHIV